MEKTFETFGSLVFSEKIMQERLPKPVYLRWKKTVADEETLDRATADSIAHAMKRWALENGATHYTHWFQPLTGTTAEKHNAFIDPSDTGEPMTHFSGKNLIKDEPDASSFPSGGLRATFEARGYTYWDVTSPAFIKDNTLCIPTIFVSYNGDSLDRKDPLLKSIKVLSTASSKVVNLLGDKSVKRCSPVVGLEQEYFLIDKKYYDSRPDLKLTGRTLFGAPAAKGQELSDHYFGAIPTRVADFMKDVNEQLWKLGIYAKTEHNEVAPGQFELAPVYSSCNTAVDNNQLMMDVLKRTAEKHDLACLLHEKPFAGINGSGKHNNWSIVTDTGLNLFSPGDKPAENIRFLVFVCAFIQAVDDNALLLRMSASCAGNDHRLGANEAPPAIISIYLGQEIEDILMDIANPKKTAKISASEPFRSISGLSYLPHDATDRNRTSPVAFTGNKFEFRMLGSSMTAAVANTVLNSIMADSLNKIAKELEGAGTTMEIRAKALDVCKTILRKHKRVLFSGDGYTEAWIKEAEKRGLPNVRSFIESTAVLDDPKTIKMLTDLGVYTETELKSRRAAFIEQYDHILGIEVKTLMELSRKKILPSMAKQYNMLTEHATGTSAPKYLKDSTAELKKLMDGLYASVEDLDKKWTALSAKGDSEKTAIDVYYKIAPAMLECRTYIDAYEKIADSTYYDIPSYEDMLFSL